MRNFLRFALAIVIFSYQALAAPHAVRTVNQIVSERALAEIRNNNFLHSGRQSLLEEMKKYPEQLAADIKRIPISIGGTPINIDTKKQSRHVFLHIAVNLEKYFGEQIPATKNKSAPGHIGPFSITEVIYALVQNFMSPVTIRAYNKIGVGLGKEWAPIKSKTTLQASFKIINKNIIQVSIESTQPMQNMYNNTTEKVLILYSVIKFNLKSGDVTFNEYYKFPPLPQWLQNLAYFE